MTQDNRSQGPIVGSTWNAGQIIARGHLGALKVTIVEADLDDSGETQPWTQVPGHVVFQISDTYKPHPHDEPNHLITRWLIITR